MSRSVFRRPVSHSMTEQSPLPSLRPPALETLTRGRLLAYFTNTWELYEWLFGSITGDAALYRSPDPLRHPLIFYLGHTAAFYVNKLRRAGLLERGVNERFERLFEIGVDPERPGELERRDDWPDEGAVRRYRREVFERVVDVIERAPIDDPVDERHPLWAVLMGIEHDRIHFETSSVLIRQYPLADVTRPDGWIYAPANVRRPGRGMIPLAGGGASLGKMRTFPTFGWDNEYGREEVRVEPFEVGRNLVTNDELLEFVRDGGYGNDRLWCAQGREWRSRTGARHPRFWMEADGGYRYRAMFDEIDMPLDWPAEVNGLEARAFCRWRGGGIRLATEPEYAFVARLPESPAEDESRHEAANLNLRFGSPSPAGMLRREPGERINDASGNVWVWLQDDFRPLPGFRPHPLYEDFSEPFFDDRHATLLGGSWATTGAGASRWYRLWFRRHFFQHAGLRLARDAA